MKKLVTISMAIMLIAVLAINALAVAVPTQTVVQNLNGVQQYIKVFTVSPETDPATLIEEPFDFGGYTYSYSDITKRENLFSETKEEKQVISVTTEKKDLAKVLEAFSPTLEFDDGKYSGTLNLDHTTVKTEAAGYETRSYSVSATQELDNLDSNDMAYVPGTTVKDGITIPLTSVDWQVQSTVLVGDLLVPATYKAVAYYSGRAYYSAATGYISTAEYKGTVSCCEVRDITYTVTYVGTPIFVATASPTEEPKPAEGRVLTEGSEEMNIVNQPEANGKQTVLYVLAGVLLLALLGSGIGLAIHSVKKKQREYDYHNEEGVEDDDDD